MLFEVFYYTTDSVHNDGERHIPYIAIYPNSTISKLYAWAKFQLPNGMIQEQLVCENIRPPPQVRLQLWYAMITIEKSFGGRHSLGACTKDCGSVVCV